MVATTDTMAGKKGTKKPAAAKVEAAPGAKSKKAGTEATKEPAKSGKADVGSGVRLDSQQTTLIPGNTVTFVGDVPDDAGKITAKITAPGGPFFANLAPGGDGDVRLSKIIERPGKIKVELFNDGKKYAEGNWEV